MKSRFEFSSGDVIAGRYVIEAPLGSSPSALTFSANENHSQEKICLKIFRPDLSQILLSSDDFLPRSRLLPALSHDNLAIVHDVRESEGLVVVAREMPEGPDFGTFAGARSENRLTRGLEFVWQAAQSLVYLHEKTCHLNLHPGNLLLTGFAAKITDPDPRLFSGMEAPQQPLPWRPEYRGYVSPEARHEGRLPYPSSDLFSLGGLFFLLVTGRHPFPNPEENRRMLTALPREIGDFLAKAMHPDPEKRFTGAEEFSDVLWSLQGVLQQLKSSPPAPPQPTVEPIPVPDSSLKGRTEIFPGPLASGGTLFGQVAQAAFAEEESRPTPPNPIPPALPAASRKPMSSLEMPPPSAPVTWPVSPKPKTTLASLEQDAAELTLSGGNKDGLTQYGFKGAKENMTLAIQQEKKRNFRKTAKIASLAVAAAVIFFGGLFFILKALGKKPSMEPKILASGEAGMPETPKYFPVPESDPVVQAPRQTRKPEAPPQPRFPDPKISVAEELAAVVRAGNWPADAAGRLKMGDELNDFGKVAEANLAYAKALETPNVADPDQIHALGGLAVTFEKMGMKDEAVRAAEKLLGLQPGNKFAKKLLERLR